MKIKYSNVKRYLDIIISLFACVITFLLIYPILSIAMFIEDRGSSLFVQKRIGINRMPFYMYKFRTMHLDADQKRKVVRGRSENGFLQVKDDNRVTKIGKILRKTSIDELPQFFNVLRGDMSLVGPRPLVKEDVNMLSKEHQRRHLVLPGITGYAQIKGRSLASRLEREKNDLYYVDHMTFLLDVKIILKTLCQIFNTHHAI